MFDNYFYIVPAIGQAVVVDDEFKGFELDGWFIHGHACQGCDVWDTYETPCQFIKCHGQHVFEWLS